MVSNDGDASAPNGGMSVTKRISSKVKGVLRRKRYAMHDGARLFVVP